nr:hypothetical protein CFP56_78345 [Quercus suber]
MCGSLRSRLSSWHRRSSQVLTVVLRSARCLPCCDRTLPSLYDFERIAISTTNLIKGAGRKSTSSSAELAVSEVPARRHNETINPRQKTSTGVPDRGKGSSHRRWSLARSHRSGRSSHENDQVLEHAGWWDIMLF